MNNLVALLVKLADLAHVWLRVEQKAGVANVKAFEEGLQKKLQHSLKQPYHPDVTFLRNGGQSDRSSKVFRIKHEGFEEMEVAVDGLTHRIKTILGDKSWGPHGSRMPYRENNVAAHMSDKTLRALGFK